MGQRLRMLYNQLDKTPEEQLDQINMALQSIDGWAGGVRSTLVLTHNDDSEVDVSTNSLDWKDCTGLNADFKPNNNLCQFIIKAYLVSDTSEAEIGVFIDDELVENFVSSFASRETHCLTGFFNTSAGITHNINIKWKVNAAGNVYKYFRGNNKIQILAVNN